jgi:hypothetical protein
MHKEKQDEQYAAEIFPKTTRNSIKLEETSEDRTEDLEFWYPILKSTSQVSMHDQLIFRLFFHVIFATKNHHVPVMAFK